ncbi:MAG: biotin--[acetyl-CoA-carboxylase] ligase, partial [Bacillota bacterium]
LLKKDYRNLLLNKNKIFSCLKDRDKHIKNNNIHIFNELDSTNNKAKEYLKEKEQMNKDIKVILAEKQSRGRGRRGNDWLSNNELGLWVSFLFPLNLPRKKIPQITIIGALTVQKTLKKYNIDSQIKWPNDVLVKEKKISGILTEMILINKSAVPVVVMGIGLNINQDDFSENISRKATSMYKLKGYYLDKNEVFCELFLNFKQFLHQYSSGNRKKIIDIWKKELKLIGKQVELNYENKSFQVYVEDILENGELYCRLENGEMKVFPTAGTSLVFNSIKANEKKEK